MRLYAMPLLAAGVSLPRLPPAPAAALIAPIAFAMSAAAASTPAFAAAVSCRLLRGAFARHMPPLLSRLLCFRRMQLRFRADFLRQPAFSYAATAPLMPRLI